MCKANQVKLKKETNPPRKPYKKHTGGIDVIFSSSVALNDMRSCFLSFFPKLVLVVMEKVLSCIFLISYAVAFILAPALMKQCLQLPSQTYKHKGSKKIQTGKCFFCANLFENIHVVQAQT